MALLRKRHFTSRFPVALATILLVITFPNFNVARASILREPTRSECAGYAEHGACDDGSPHLGFMEAHCPHSCEAWERRKREDTLRERGWGRRINPGPLGHLDNDQEGDSGDEDSEDHSSDDEEDGEEHDQYEEGHHDFEEDKYNEYDDDNDVYEDEGSVAASFFQLGALDIDGDQVGFHNFRGRVTIIVNVASKCGYTEDHYSQLVALYDKFSKQDDRLSILAFPCNQFGKQEPGSPNDIKRFAEEMGVKFTMMDKIQVNGPETHPVYRYLKRIAGPPEIEWNFATYYIVGPDGAVQSYTDVEPEDLENLVFEMLGGVRQEEEL